MNTNTRERPYDTRWGTQGAVLEEFHITEAELKKIYLDGWVKARQVGWRDDDHRAQAIYCFEDLHQYLETMAHPMSEGYVKKFWNAKELAEAVKAAPRGPFRRVA